MTFSWVDDYVIARKILGWSDDEFWNAFPRKLYAVYYAYLDLQDRINNAQTQQKVLVGEEAVMSLKQIAQKIV